MPEQEHFVYFVLTVGVGLVLAGVYKLFIWWTGAGLRLEFLACAGLSDHLQPRDATCQIEKLFGRRSVFGKSNHLWRLRQHLHSRYALNVRIRGLCYYGFIWSDSVNICPGIQYLAAASLRLKTKNVGIFSTLLIHLPSHSSKTVSSKQKSRIKSESQKHFFMKAFFEGVHLFSLQPIINCNHFRVRLRYWWISVIPSVVSALKHI